MAIALFVNGAKGIARCSSPGIWTCSTRRRSSSPTSFARPLARISGTSARCRAKSRSTARISGWLTWKPRNQRRTAGTVALRASDRQASRRGRHARAQRSVAAVRIQVRSQAVPYDPRTGRADSTVYADEASSWDALHARFATRRINHSRLSSDGDAYTNKAESFFSRLRRAEIGTHHKIAAVPPSVRQ